MTQFDKVLYTAKVHTTGGRDGTARSGDGRLDINLSPPGTSGSGTNPEQLFAAGWSACFLSAVKIVARKRKVTLPAGTAVDAGIKGEPRTSSKRKAPALRPGRVHAVSALRQQRVRAVDPDQPRRIRPATI